MGLEAFIGFLGGLIICISQWRCRKEGVEKFPFFTNFIKVTASLTQVGILLWTVGICFTLSGVYLMFLRFCGYPILP
jgi:hypothetical protein